MVRNVTSKRNQLKCRRILAAVEKNNSQKAPYEAKAKSIHSLLKNKAYLKLLKRGSELKRQQWNYCGWLRGFKMEPTRGR